MIQKRYRVLLAVVIIVGLPLVLGLTVLAQRRPDLLGLEKPATSDALKLKTVADIPLGGGSSRFDYQSINPDDGRLYIAHLGSSLVTDFDLRAQKVIKDIPDISEPHGVLAVPSLHSVYVTATGDDQVAVIDETSLSVIKRIPVGHYPDGLAYDPGTKKLFVSDESGGTVSVVNAESGSFIRDISLGGEIGNTQYDPVDKIIYSAAQGRNQLVAIDPQQERITAQYDLPGCSGPHGFIIDPSPHYALVTCESNAKLVVFDLGAKKIISTDTVGATPDVLALDQGLHRMYIFVAYWFHNRFGVSPGLLGAIFFGANILAGISALLAARIARTTGAAVAPVIAGPLLGSAALASLPFFISGSLKIVYDLLLYHSFRSHRPKEGTGT